MQHPTPTMARSSLPSGSQPRQRGPAAHTISGVGTAAHSLPGAMASPPTGAGRRVLSVLVTKRSVPQPCNVWVLCPATHRYLLLSYMFALWATDAVIRLITSV